MTEVIYRCPNCARQSLGEHNLIMKFCGRCSEKMEVIDEN
jgi:DNA-directed RNA polymerase subunit RPC12/RpoP